MVRAVKDPIQLPLTTPELHVEDAGGIIRRTVHPSGVRVLTERVPGARSVSIGFWIGVGSRDEQGEHDDAPASLGSTHFLEHLLFKGTTTRNAYEIATTFDRMGAEHNALTAKEFTCYYAKTRDADLPRTVEVLGDMVTSSILDPHEFENERGVILEEIAMAADDLSDVANERFFEAVLEKHPLGRPIGGDNDTIRAAKRDAVFGHYLNTYRPSTLVVTAAGAVDHDELVDLVLQALDRAPGEHWSTDQLSAPAQRRSVERERSTGEAAAVTKLTARPGEQVHVLVGTEGLRAGDPRRFAFGMMNAVLGGGMSSRLFQEIREKRGLAYSAFSFGASYSDTGLFGMYAATSPEKAREVAKLAEGELRQIAETGITEEEFERTLGQIAGSSALALEDSDTKMGRLARAELGTGELYGYDASMERFGRVTAEEIREIAGFFADRQLTTVGVGDVARSGFEV